MSPFDGLATEMIIEIIEAISSCQDSLLSISLVSRLFIRHARNRLFSNLNINHIDRIHQLSALLNATHCSIPQDIDRIAITVSEQPRGTDNSRFIADAVCSVNNILKILRARHSYVLDLRWATDTYMPIHAGGDFPHPQLFKGIWLRSTTAQLCMLREFMLAGRFSDLRHFAEAVSEMSCLECLVVYARWRIYELPITKKPPPRLRELRITCSSQAILGWLLGAQSEHSSLRLVKIISSPAPKWFTLNVDTIEALFRNVFDRGQAACLWIDNRVQVGVAMQTGSIYCQWEDAVRSIPTLTTIAFFDAHWRRFFYPGQAAVHRHVLIWMNWRPNWIEARQWVETNGDAYRPGRIG